MRLQAGKTIISHNQMEKIPSASFKRYLNHHPALQGFSSGSLHILERNWIQILHEKKTFILVIALEKLKRIIEERYQKYLCSLLGGTIWREAMVSTCKDRDLVRDLYALESYDYLINGVDLICHEDPKEVIPEPEVVVVPDDPLPEDFGLDISDYNLTEGDITMLIDSLGHE